MNHWKPLKLTESSALVFLYYSSTYIKPGELGSLGPLGLGQIQKTKQMLTIMKFSYVPCDIWQWASLHANLNKILINKNKVDGIFDDPIDFIDNITEIISNPDPIETASKGQISSVLILR